MYEHERRKGLSLRGGDRRGLLWIIGWSEVPGHLPVRYAGTFEAAKGYEEVRLERFQSSGGCQPAITQRRRALTRCSLLSWRATTVARPQAVCPVIRVPSSLQRKCSRQVWRRGLKRDTRSPLSGSVPCVCVPLWPLHNGQASQRFSSVEEPPAAWGMICSTCMGMAVYACGVKQ